MKYWMCRYTIPLPLFVMAAVNIWLLLQMAAKNVAVIGHYTAVHGEIYQWDEDGAIVVKLLPPGADYSEAEPVRLRALSTLLIGSRDEVCESGRGRVFPKIEDGRYPGLVSFRSRL